MLSERNELRETNTKLREHKDRLHNDLGQLRLDYSEVVGKSNSLETALLVQEQQKVELER